MAVLILMDSLSYTTEERIVYIGSKVYFSVYRYVYANLIACEVLIVNTCLTEVSATRVGT